MKKEKYHYTTGKPRCQATFKVMGMTHQCHNEATKGSKYCKECGRNTRK